MKKILSLSLALLLILSFPISGRAQDIGQNKNVDRNKISNEIWDKYIKLDEFQRHYKENPEDAKSMIENIIDHNVKILDKENYFMPSSGNGSISLIDYYPKFKQNNYYYCGPATALTAIYGMGQENKVSGSTYSSKQSTLGQNMGSKSGDGSYVYKMRNELNKYSSHDYDYFYEPTKSSMHYIIDGSLLSDNAPILHANTEKIGYYNGHKTGHYITIVFYNSSFGDNEVGGLAVMDNNPDDNYYGTRSISFNEAYNAIRERYLIGVSL